MHGEIVRPDGLSSELLLQLLLGNAIETVLLIKARALEQVQPADREALRRVANWLSQGAVDADSGASSSTAVAGDPLTTLSAARDALRPDDMASLLQQLNSLATALRELADEHDPSMSLVDIVEQLTSLWNVLAARTATEPDEVHSLFPAD
jgi:hypothetical protein